MRGRQQSGNKSCYSLVEAITSIAIEEPFVHQTVRKNETWRWKGSKLGKLAVNWGDGGENVYASLRLDPHGWRSEILSDLKNIARCWNCPWWGWHLIPLQVRPTPQTAQPNSTPNIIWFKKNIHVNITRGPLLEHCTSTSAELIYPC